MSRRVEIGVTLLIVALLTALIVAGALRREPDPPPTPAVQAPPPPPTPSPEVVNAPELTETWREEFDTLDGWRLERGTPATLSGGIVTLHDAPELAPLYAQRQPLRFQSADVTISARCDPGGYLDLAVARAVAGRESELVAPGNTPDVRDGVELRLDWNDPNGAIGWMRWKCDEHHWFTLPTQGSVLPSDRFTTAVLHIRPEGCSVTIDGEPRGEYTITKPHLRWQEAPYRIYLGASAGDPEIDFIELRPVTIAPDAPQEETP